MMHLPGGNDAHLLTDEDADRLRTLYTLTGGQLPSHQSVEIIPGFTPGTIVHEHDPEIAAIEHNLGVHRYQRPGRRSDPRRRPARRDPRQSQDREPLAQEQPEPRPALSGLAAAAAHHWPHFPDTVAKAVAAKWEHCGFTDAQAVAWWDGGVQFDFPETAVELNGYGVTPHHLQLVIRKETVGTRLHEGRLTPRQVADLLRREGHLQIAG